MCSLVQQCAAAMCSNVQPCATMCSHVQPCATICSHVQPCAAMYSLVQPWAATCNSGMSRTPNDSYISREFSKCTAGNVSQETKLRNEIRDSFFTIEFLGIRQQSKIENKNNNVILKNIVKVFRIYLQLIKMNKYTCIRQNYIHISISF